MLSPRPKPRTTPKIRRLKLVRLNRLLRRHENLWERAVKPVFRRQMMRVSARIESTGGYALEELELAFANELSGVMMLQYRRTMSDFRNVVVQDGKSAMPWERKEFLDIWETAVRTWLGRYALRRATQVAGNFFADVRNELESSYAEGLGAAAAARRVRQVVGDAWTVWKAQRLARTEAHTASSVGMEEAVRSTGLQVDREWLAAEDNRTRESHALADGQIRAVDEPFQVGGVSMMFPGDPDGPAKEVVNCRCTLLYHPR